MTEPRCKTCGKPIDRRPENPYDPFCSRRCRLLDLGRWFDESYRVPGQPAELPDDDETGDDRG